MHFLRPDPPPTSDSDAFRQRMKQVGRCLREAGVGVIYLVHGTFIGPDGLGLLAELSRVAPQLADTLRHWNKQLLDSVAGDLGNFTTEFAQTLESGLQSENEPKTPVRLFHWSSENHHVGRADGAVRLAAELLSQPDAPESRRLLIGHSHGGNVFSLLTNLLGGDEESRRAFFDAAQAYYRVPVFGNVNMPTWKTVQEQLAQLGSRRPMRLDLVTLGTPVRYGWELNGCEKLLHIVNHRPVPGLPLHQAPFPPTGEALWHAEHGDFVQQFGIAGTNFTPPLWAWRAWNAEMHLGHLLQPKDQPLDLLARLRLGTRTHEDGENLLVDYGRAVGTPAQHLFGHAVYTKQEWMLFHVEEIARRFYALRGPD